MTASGAPRVSVCIPTYEYGRYLRDAVESVLAQTFGDLEVIVVDNASSDETEEVAAACVQLDHRVRARRSESTVGMAANWNRALVEARGEYVKVLCADDVLDPPCLERSVALLDRYPQATLATCGRTLATEDLRPGPVVAFRGRGELADGRPLIRQCLLHGNLVGEPTAVTFRRAAASSGFDPRYAHLADLEMWLRLLELGKLASTPDVLCRIRQHGAQETGANVRSLAFLRDEFTLIKDYADRSYVGFSTLRKLEMRYTIAYYVWLQLAEGAGQDAVDALIAEHCDPRLFRAFLAVKRVRRALAGNRTKRDRGR